MSGSDPTGIVVICTKNRPADVERALDSIDSAVARVPVMIVDSSDTRETEELVARRPSSDIEYVRADPGLTHQRNVALDRLAGRDVIVHFIDDDVEVDPSYFERLEHRILSDPTIGGAGGVVRGGERRRPGVLTRITLLDSVRPGRVLISGFNVGAFEFPRVVDVDWLPGCSMSFRRSAVGDKRFDELRTGYALGEDVDFGMNMSGSWRLVHSPDAALLHHESPANRLKREVLAVQAVHSRWRLAHAYGDRVKPWAVVVSSLALTAKYVVDSLRRDRSLNLRLARSTIVGLATVRRVP